MHMYFSLSPEQSVDFNCCIQVLVGEECTGGGSCFIFKWGKF